MSRNQRRGRRGAKSTEKKIKKSGVLCASANFAFNLVNSGKHQARLQQIGLCLYWVSRYKRVVRKGAEGTEKDNKKYFALFAPLR